MLLEIVRFLREKRNADDWLPYIAETEGMLGVLRKKWDYYSRHFRWPRSFFAFVSGLDVELRQKLEKRITEFHK